MKRKDMVLQFGKVYEVMGRYDKYNHRLGMARADVVRGQEVLVSAYSWTTRRPEIYKPIHRVGLTGKIFTDAEMLGTGFGTLFGAAQEAK